MQIQVNKTTQIRGNSALNEHVESVVEGALARFAERITRVEVHLSDENSSAKHGTNDMRCVMEARLAGMQPITVSHHSGTLEQAYEGAADKLEKTLSRALERQHDVRGRTSASGDETA